MSTLEVTTTMLGDLNEDELLSIQQFITRIKSKHDFNQFKSKEEVLTRLDESKRQADDGLSQDATAFIKEIHDKYGL